ncbi:hypothetical protein R3P38DRAFT_3272476 [Favolaschia claudopus]|uniref:F-box domain-containing protein n=1 Tax=Favolaschia claudopus TaxID=2862362 RepID=A0AAW0B3T8_9AGAR
MSLIQSLPSEILIQIWATVSQHKIRRLIPITQVCARWRAVALGASELWLDIQIFERDINHSEVVLEHFRRSQDRPIRLELQLISRKRLATSSRIHTFFQSVVLPNIWRCWSLTVRGTTRAWEVVLPQLAHQTFPLLRELDIADVEYWLSVSSPPNRQDLTFPLLANHPIEKLAMHAINVGQVALPCLRALRVGDMDGVIGDDGYINEWLLEGPESLELCRWVIPAMYFQTADDRVRGVSSVKHLKLAHLHASTTTEGTQNDCAPFFDALETPAIRTLELEAFHGRVLEDFMFSLQPQTVGTAKYSLVSRLTLRSLDFPKPSYRAVAFFLVSFPALESIAVIDCPQPTWECCIQVLTLDPTRCPKVSTVEVNGVRLERNEPLPFALADLLDRPTEVDYSEL